MKCIILFFLLLPTTRTPAQTYPTPVTDTLNYLRYIIANKQQFIGLPFSTLHSNLQINVKMFLPHARIHKKQFSETGIGLAFKFAATAEAIGGTYPHLEITWEPPYLNIDDALDLKSLYERQGIGWNAIIYNRYQNMVIKNIFLYE